MLTFVDGENSRPGNTGCCPNSPPFTMAVGGVGVSDASLACFRRLAAADAVGALKTRLRTARSTTGTKSEDARVTMLVPRRRS